ncbi:CAAX protease, partial [Mycobacterium sp. E802]|uniref:CPBP family intramembrane glutamic endopeptidase n=1 Tax=Mycobacterium sp. E802 TaxID=1834152 RepID=UPI0008005D9A
MTSSAPGSHEFLNPPRRTLKIEIAVVLAVTFGLSAYTAGLRLIEAVLLGLSGQTVALNPKRSPFDLIDLGLHLAVILQLLAWGALALYLLWRSGIGPAAIGLGRPRWRADGLGGLGLAALIGLPGLGFYVLARVLGLSADVEPAELYDTWWRIPTLLGVAFANGWAEEIIVVGFLLTRLRQLDVSAGRALLISSLLRGAYHLYQGYSAGLGNIVMGLAFG